MKLRRMSSAKPGVPNVDATAGMQARAERVFTQLEVSTHDKPDDAWLIIKDNVYDISKFWRRHPGGKVIMSYVGMDATDAFLSQHTLVQMEKRLKYMQVGVLDRPAEVPKVVDDFRALRASFEERGLFKGDVWWFMRLYGLIYLYQAIGLCLLYAYPDSWWAFVASSSIVGIAFGQGGFLQHDLGHSSVFESARYNYLAQVAVMGFCMGGSARWWTGRHSRHHARPNHTHWDLDIKTLPLFAWSVGQFVKGPTSILRWQAFTFPIFGPPPLMFLYHVLTFQWLLKHDWKELFVMISHFVLWWIPLRNYGIGASLIYFSIYTAWAGGYMGWMFSLNHYMFPLHNKPLDWVSQTALTTQNVTGGWLVDYVTGGLNYQIEHHLFPTMPRHNYPIVHAEVKEMMHRNGLPCIEQTFWGAVWDVEKKLWTVSRDGLAAVAANKAANAANKRDQEESLLNERVLHRDGANDDVNDDANESDTDSSGSGGDDETAEEVVTPSRTRPRRRVRGMA
eukprot:TRINITY_DN2846_c1_g2_i1.p1 TRINITY_DN2846_c1_g2~~TRINITY_DN2846_c1_g2_i1.p1  ORF type:complete len:507 (+),score=104.68 TRINITY_DN2846_c1_g2_i1:257-1777(+)